MNDEIVNKLIKMIEDLAQKQSSKTRQMKTDGQNSLPDFTNKDLAAFFRVTTRTLHSWRKDHGLKAVYLSKRIYYHEEDVIEYLRSNRQ